MASNYVGRFAPSPSGPLHMGSLVAAMASYLDARVHGGQWLVRIEDVDEGRSVAGADQAILAVLMQLGMRWDGDVVWQSRRTSLYAAAFERLAGHTYPCGCNRREIADSRLGFGSDGAAIYPGTCRHGLPEGKTMRSVRVQVPEPGPDGKGDLITFDDRQSGVLSQHLASAAGDFVLKRADGFWAYQLAVVVDDAAQGVTDIVRGADLIDSTPRQIFLQGLLGMPTPRYWHVPVLRNADGEKLSKQSGAQALTAASTEAALAHLRDSARHLGLTIGPADSITRFWQLASSAWDRMLTARPGSR